MDSTYDVVVIGGGLAGLTAAATASRGGANVLSLDRQHVGGRAATDERAGFLLNRGAHALYRSGSAIEVLKRLGITPRGTAPQLDEATVLFDGELLALPNGPSSLARSRWLDRRDKLQFSLFLASVSAWPLHSARRLASSSAADWLAAQDLRPKVRLLAEALVHVTSYCSDLERVSADVVALQLGRGTRYGVLYLDGGWQRLADSLRGHIPAQQRARVDSISSTSGGFAVESDAGSYRAHSIVVAVESPAAAHRLLAGLGSDLPALRPPNAVTAACLDLVALTYPRPSFILGIDDPVYLSLHSAAADLRAEANTPRSVAGPHVVHLLRYGACSAAVDRPLLEATARRAGLDPAAGTVRFLADLTVVSDAPLPSSGGLAGRPDIDFSGVPGCYVAGDWVGPDDFLAGTSLASGERAGTAAAAHVTLRRTGNGKGRAKNTDEASAA
jgi:glycine/D-amino acid oxidase-like deaminating enzyme